MVIRWLRYSSKHTAARARRFCAFEGEMNFPVHTAAPLIQPLLLPRACVQDFYIAPTFALLSSTRNTRTRLKKMLRINPLPALLAIPCNVQSSPEAFVFCAEKKSFFNEKNVPRKVEKFQPLSIAWYNNETFRKRAVLVCLLLGSEQLLVVERGGKKLNAFTGA